MTTFSELGLSEISIQALARKGFEEPTPIQIKTIPAVLAGENDIVAQAQTGTGKTAAFGLPLLEMLNPDIRTVPQRVAAPADGRLLKVDPHAFILLVDGVGILVHIGINTVRLEGRLFEVLAERGEQVTAGTPIVSWDPASVTDPDMARTILVVLMDQAPDSIVSPAIGTDVVAGDVLFTQE